MYTTPNLRRSQQRSMHLHKKDVFHRFILKKIQPRNFNIISQKYYFLLRQSQRNLGRTSYQSYEDKFLIHNCNQSRDKVAVSSISEF